MLRDKLEALYRKDVQSRSQEMSKLQQEGVDLWVNVMKAKEARVQASGESPVVVKGEESVGSDEKESISEWSLADKSDSESLNLPSEVKEMLETDRLSVRM